MHTRPSTRERPTVAEGPALDLGRQRLIAYNRVVLALAALLAGQLLSGSQGGLPPVVTALLLAFCGYAVAFALLAALARRAMGTSFIISLLIDLLAVVPLLMLTRGPASPFFLLLAFLLVTTAVAVSDSSHRWFMSGAVLAMFVVLVSTLWSAALSDDDLHRVVMRGMFLVLFVWWVARWRAYESKRVRDTGLLAGWPASLNGATDFVRALDATLRHAATVMRADRVLLFWRAADETSLRSAEYEGGRTRLARYELPDVRELVAEPLAEADFFCARLDTPRPLVVVDQWGVLSEWQGRPVADDFPCRFSAQDILSVRLCGEGHDARAMFFGLTTPTSDTLVLARAVGRQLATLLSWMISEQRERESTAMKARRRIADDLHDGLLQALSGISLALERLHPAVAGDHEALRQLDEIQDALAEEQRLLRLLVLNPTGIAKEVDGDSFGLDAELHRMAARLHGQYGAVVSVHLSPGWRSLVNSAAREIYLLVHEAVLNSLRHGHANHVEVTLGKRGSGGLMIAVRDHGTGFDFRGRHDLRTLQARGWAPKSLARRVSGLDGDMTIESSADGASVEIAIPLPAASAGDPYAEALLLPRRPVSERACHDD